MLLCILVISSCSSEEPVSEEFSSDQSIADIYAKYSENILKQFEISMSEIFNQTRASLHITTPQELGEYLSSLSEEELSLLYEDLSCVYSNANDIKESALSNFIDEIGAQETQELYNFCEDYAVSTDKVTLLATQVQNKSEYLKNIYIATAAQIDCIADAIADPIIEYKTVHVVIKGYYGECEHQLVLDFAKMCVGDVLVEFMGGGPENIGADITCEVGDLAEVISSIISYIDCKKKK